MKRIVPGIACLLLACASLVIAQVENTAARTGNRLAGKGRVVVPAASIEHPQDAGKRMHTHFRILVPPGNDRELGGFAESAVHPEDTPVAGYYAETPASLACVYGLVTVTKGCNPATLPNSKHATGGSRAIAIVDAYDYPTAMDDLNAYSAQFGLPGVSSSNFTVLDQLGGTNYPSYDPNCADYYGWSCWEAEEALDIEMAHAMAPNAHIYLIEANSSSDGDLFTAVQTAIKKVKAAGGGEISMSWGGQEWNTENAEVDNTYLKPSLYTGSKAVLFASTGDSWGTEFPSVSPYVVAVGGTTLMRDPSNLNGEYEIAWEDGGGGFSQYEARPSYQNGIASQVGKYRGVPDIAAVANPNTGVWVYDSFDTDDYSTGNPAPWNILGGTSVASPLMAGIVNNSNHFYADTTTELTAIYIGKGASPNWRDVTTGTCGYYQGWLAKQGWDPCTGLGVSRNRSGK